MVACIKCSGHKQHFVTSSQDREAYEPDSRDMTDRDVEKLIVVTQKKGSHQLNPADNSLIADGLMLYQEELSEVS